MTEQSHFQTSSTSSAKVVKLAKGRLVASELLEELLEELVQELLEELVLPHYESIAESDHLTTCFSMF